MREMTLTKQARSSTKLQKLGMGDLMSTKCCMGVNFMSCFDTWPKILDEKLNILFFDQIDRFGKTMTVVPVKEAKDYSWRDELFQECILTASNGIPLEVQVTLIFLANSKIRIVNSLYTWLGKE